jgi:hypothetical protein
MTMMPVCHSYAGRLRGMLILMVAGMVLGGTLSDGAKADSLTPLTDGSRLWLALVSEAKSLGLPTRFLEDIPPRFVTFEFEDLHAYAAEYHPKEHRMVLDRSLSLNAAGGTLRPLGRLTHKELETLYHELFHAYMDFLEQESLPTKTHASLMAFAREQQQCRYQHVLITPVPQKKEVKEERFLSETESWEALNETWAVFVGWTVWTQLELDNKKGREPRSSGKSLSVAGWIKRLEQAEKDATLKGYYEPEDPNEKLMARKRFLAPEFRLSAPELKVLMQDVLGSSNELIRHAVRVASHTRAGFGHQKTCPLSVLE